MIGIIIIEKKIKKKKKERIVLSFKDPKESLLSETTLDVAQRI
jgi:hypothetical protein